MVEREKLGGDSFRVRTVKGEATWTMHTPEVVGVRFSGFAEVVLLEPIMGELAVLLEKGRIHCFADLEGLENYEPELWAKAQDYLSRYRQKMAGVYVLQRSSAVVMGVKLLNLFCKDALLAYSSRSEYERKLRQCIRMSS